MDTSALEGIGLSNLESKIFIKLLELGESKAGSIIKKTGMQSSSVYNAINSLINKGLVSYIRKGGIKIYKASSPEVVLNYIEMKKIEYSKILPELKAKQNQQKASGVEFYQSYKGIKNLISELIKDAKRGEVYKTFSIEDLEDYKIAKEKVFSLVKKLFKNKAIERKGIFHEKNRSRKKPTTTIKKRYLNFSMPPNTMVLGDKVGIISWKEEPIGILISSKELAKSYSDFFDHLWKVAKK